MDNFFKVLGWIFGVLFVVSAVVQYNDPDPLLWIAIYCIAAFVSFGFALKKIPSWLPILLGVLGVVGFFYVFPEKFEGFEIGEGDIKNIEEGREAFGLLIVAVVMIVFGLRMKFFGKSKI